MTETTSADLLRVADLCREAHDNILMYGWAAGDTVVGREEDGLCLGSALGMAAGLKTSQSLFGTKWDWQSFAGDKDRLCADGHVFVKYARPLIADGGDDAMLAYWNDRQVEDDPVLDLLLGCEKAMREDAAR